jgi:hypothetical protein
MSKFTEGLRSPYVVGAMAAFKFGLMPMAETADAQQHISPLQVCVNESGGRERRNGVLYLDPYNNTSNYITAGDKPHTYRLEPLSDFSVGVSRLEQPPQSPTELVILRTENNIAPNNLYADGGLVFQEDSGEVAEITARNITPRGQEGFPVLEVIFDIECPDR